MSALSRYLRSVGGGGLTFWCQGCNEAHTVWVGEGPGPRWSWNGDAEKPVFGPSVLVTWEGGEECIPHRCHTFIGRNGAQPGEIIFLSDCTHALAGETMPLAEMPPHRYRDEDVS